jgi:hypothetical protein
MPDIRNSEVYQRRAAAWRERAPRLAEGDAARDVCVSIAVDYDRLALTLEERERLPAKPAIRRAAAGLWCADAPRFGQN